MIVTGGAGFIGGNFVLEAVKHYDVIVLDSLTYASNYDYIKYTGSRFELADIRNLSHVKKIFSDFKPNYIVHFAAESHVDNSIDGPLIFVETNVLGTANILEAMRTITPDSRLVHISTDEVYGSIESGNFTEDSRLDPSSPYSSTKAASDLLALSYNKTFGLDVIVTNSSNNYGPNQNIEKLIPKTICNALQNYPIPIYGDGKNIRDWIFVDDNVNAIMQVIETGESGGRYNIGGGYEIANYDLANLICDMVDQIKGVTDAPRKQLIELVKDRPAHDRRYSVSNTKIETLGWKPKVGFKDGLYGTIEWYISNLSSCTKRLELRQMQQSEPILNKCLDATIRGI